MSQNLFNQIDPTVTDGNELARLLNEQRNVVASQSAGTNTPSWATYGTTWVDSSDPANPLLMISNGDTSVQVGSGGQKNNGTPLGVVAAWAGAQASIPTGWAICDGTLYGEVQSPDLRDKFIVGAGGASNPSEIGGGDTAAGDAGLEFMALCYIIKITGDIGDGPMGPPGTPGADGISVPIGGIIMWSDPVVPANWALCDGTAVNGITTPNLVSRFIVGAGPVYAIGTTGGFADATLPQHGHSAVSDPMSSRAVASGETNVAGNHGHNGNFQVNDPGHSHMSQGRGAPNGGGDGSAYTTNGPAPGHSTNHVGTGITISGGTDLQGDHTHSFSVSIDVGGGPVTVQPEGGDPSGKNLPPFYALSYIMRVA
jgi:hypothetical protein